MRLGSRRESIGGSVVRDSLRGIGHATIPEGVALVETALSTRPAHTVLVQNAWNVIPKPQFDRLVDPYPRPMARKMRARRLVAQWNLRRAKRLVCLTQAMAHMTEQSVGRATHVAQVTAPLDILPSLMGDRTSQAGDVSNPYALVIGTVTWFKRPHLAIEYLASTMPEVSHVKFLGRDDGSGCWQHVQRLADRHGVVASRDLVPRSQLWSEYASAHVTVLPSALESLGFALSEALLLAHRVVASPLPAHQEISNLLRVTPTWLEPESPRWSAPGFVDKEPTVDGETLNRQWRRLASELGL